MPTNIMPDFAIGKVSATGKGWTSVMFTDQNGNVITVKNPTIVATVEYRGGIVPTTEYGAPPIMTPEILAEEAGKAEMQMRTAVTTHMERMKLKAVSLSGIQDLAASVLEERVSSDLKQILGDWGILNNVRNKLRSVFKRLAKAIGHALGDVLEKILKPAIDSSLKKVADETMDKVNTAFRDHKEKLDAALTQNYVQIKEAFNHFGGDVKGIMDSNNRQMAQSLNETMTDAFGQMNANVTDSVNKSIKNLYESIGIPEGQLISPAQIRSVTNSGFEFYSMGGGTTLHYIAMSGIPKEIIDKESEPDTTLPFPFPFKFEPIQPPVLTPPADTG